MNILVIGTPAGVASCDVAAGGRPAICTHGALAVSADGERWVLLNAGRSLGAQLRDEPSLRRRRDAGASIAGVVLLDAHMDDVSGLLSLRDGPPIELHCTPCVFEDLTSGLPLLPLLQHYCGVHWHVLPVAGDCLSAGFTVEGAPGLRFLALAIDGPASAYSPHRHDPGAGDHIGLVVEDDASGERLLYAPGLAQAREDARAAFLDAAELLLDSVV